MRLKIHAAIFYYGLLLLVVALALYPPLVNILIILLSANYLIEGGYKRKFELIRERRLVLLLVGFYALHLIGLLYSSNTDVGWFNLEKKFTLLIFPIVLGASIHEIDGKWMDRILLGFVAACFVFSAICLGHGLYLWKTEGTTLYLVGEDLTDFTGTQSIYFGIYVTLAAGILMNFLLTRQLSLMQRLAIATGIGYFFLFMIVLSARMGTLTFGLVVAVGGLYYARKRNALRAFFITGAILVVVGITLVFKVDYLRDRVMSLVETKFYFDPEENNANGLTLRLVKWQCSLEGIRSSPVIGVGTGDMQDVLQACYNEKNFWGRVFEFNSHNQYLQTGLGLGIIGMMVLFACLGWMGWLAFRAKDYLTLCFLIAVGFAFLTESVLERKQGVLFYSLFSALLIFHGPATKR